VTDQADARSVALVALRTPTLALVGAEDDLPAVVRLLADRRDELNQERRRVTNRLHRLLRDLVAGGAPTPLRVDTAARLLRRTRPTTAADQQRKALAHELLADLRRMDRQLAINRTRCQELLASRPSRLLEVFGISAVLAVKLIGHSGDITRFASPDHYASYTGTAPVDASSGPNLRQRVNRGGNRALNTAIHLVARTQISRPGPGRTYYERKLAEGKTPNQAFRALKRQIVKVIYRALLADHQARHSTPEPATGRHTGAIKSRRPVHSVRQAAHRVQATRRPRAGTLGANPPDAAQPDTQMGPCLLPSQGPAPRLSLPETLTTADGQQGLDQARPDGC
jgi:transposase